MKTKSVRASEEIPAQTITDPPPNGSLSSIQAGAYLSFVFVIDISLFLMLE
jgi:formate/nitrite transporter FocA (FNT family)